MDIKKIVFAGLAIAGSAVATALGVTTLIEGIGFGTKKESNESEIQED